MAVYNAETYVAEAVDSVIDQDYANWELVVVNDGSTDKTLEILNVFRDDRIRIFSQVNRGVAAARNSALKLIKGDFFCFLDADDVLTSNSLSVRINCFTEADICFADGRVSIYDATMMARIRTWTPQKKGYVFRNLLRLDGKCFFGPTWMFRKMGSVVYRFAEDLTHGEDLFFCLSYAHLGKYAFTKDLILKYRRSPGSAMNNLIGLANGYSFIMRKIAVLPHPVSGIDKFIFDFKARKIMFLSFLGSGNPRLALKYFLWGSL